MKTSKKDEIAAPVSEAVDYYRRRKANPDLAAETDDEDDFLRTCYDMFVVEEEEKQ